MVAESTLKVIVRIRPQPDGSQGGRCLSLKDSDKTISVARDKKGVSDFTFSAGAVLGPSCTQDGLYEHCDVARDVVDGINCCVMAYGQTSSGKTHTMYGRGWEEDAVQVQVESERYSEDIGVVPRSVASLFSTLDARAADNEDFTFNVTCQVLQIYNERIYDLLTDKARENPLQMREAQRKGKNRSDTASVHIPGLSAFRVSTREDVSALLQKGLRNRAIRATDFNAVSSRSHTILQLFVETEVPDEQGLVVLRRSTFSLVDLAGSEKWRPSLDSSQGKSQQVIAEAMRRQEQEKEMVNINTSLAALGNVVSALLETGRKHIPYRDSSLTRLLQDALSGHGRTIIIATVHEDSQYVEETFSTLSFANRASRIKVTLTVSENVSESISLEEAKRQIRVLRARVQELSLAAGVANQLQVQTSQTDLARLSANSKCPSCKDLVERVRSLLQENLQLRASMAHIGETTTVQVAPASPERKGILQTMLSPLGFYKNQKTQEQQQTKLQQQAPPQQPQSSPKGKIPSAKATGTNAPQNIPAASAPVNTLSQTSANSTPSFTPTGSARASKTAVSQLEYERQYGLGARERELAVSPKFKSNRSRGSSGSRGGLGMTEDAHKQNQLAAPQQQQQHRTAESALAAARLALSVDSGDAAPETRETLTSSVGLQPTVRNASSPISSPRHNAANMRQGDAPLRGSNASLPGRYTQGSPDGSLVSRTSSLTGSLVGSLDGLGSLDSIVMQGSLDGGSLELKPGFGGNLDTGASIGKINRYDSSRIERAIQGSERTLDAAHKGRDLPSDSGPYASRGAGAMTHAAEASAGSGYSYPGPLASSFDATLEPQSGACAKHGLDKCILCLMFNERNPLQAQPRTQMPLRSSYDAAAGSGQYGGVEYSSASRSQYTYNNIGSMGDISPSVKAFNHSLGISMEGKASGGGPSPTFGSFQRPANNGMACQVHGVRDCLLCSLKQQGNSYGGLGGASSFSYNALAPLKTSTYVGSITSNFSAYQSAPTSITSGHAPDAVLGKAAHPNVRPSYGIYQPQADSDDDVQDKAEELPSGDDRDRYLLSPQSSQQRHKASSQIYGSSNIQFEDDDYAPSARATTEEDSDYTDRYIPSAPHPQSKLQTRGHSVPSSTASGLYSRPQSGDDDDYDYNAPVEAYVHQAPAVDPSAAKKKKRAANSATSRIQQVGAHNSSSQSSARNGTDSESDTDEGYYAKEREVSIRAAAGLGPTGSNDLANYLYGAPAQPKLTRRAAGESLPHLPPARIVDSGRVHSIVASKQQGSRAGLERETRRVSEVTDKPRKAGKKKVKGAPQLGGLATRRRL